MAIGGRSLIQIEFEQQLERQCPVKELLIRANPYNCSGVGSLCFKPPRPNDINPNCPVCAGTGYLGVQWTGSGVNRHKIVTLTNQPYDDTFPPASNQFRIYADIQTGHGLYGAGGDYLALIAQMGKMQIGDATAFVKMYDRDHVTGQVVYPVINLSLPRQDRLKKNTTGVVYNLQKELIAEIGSEKLCRILTLSEGLYALGTATGVV